MRSSAVIHFPRNMLDLAGRKANIRAHDVLDATIESLGPPKFSAKRFGHASVDDSSLYCIERRCRYTPFRPSSMSIRPQAKWFNKD